MSDQPQVSWPWQADWDRREECWLFINTETGERTFDYNYDRMNGGGQQGYGGGGYRDGRDRGESALSVRAGIPAAPVRM
jgi:hypothetical protein